MLLSQLPSTSLVVHQSSNVEFFSFMPYEGIQIPIYKLKGSLNLFPVTSTMIYNYFEPDLVFSSLDQICDYFVSNNIHVGEHKGNFYLYMNVDKNFINHGYFSVRPLLSSVGSFGLCWNSSSSENDLFSGVRSGDRYFDGLSFDSLFDNSLTLNSLGFLWFFHLNSMQYDQFVNGVYGDVYNYDILIRFYGYLIYPCCYPDFSPIVKILGGVPSADQLANLKSICQLLGVDTSENGLKDCDLMKSYLQRLVAILGGVPSSEPNNNLKSICYLLGVDTSENGLADCELSKEYVKRISKMLGAE